MFCNIFKKYPYIGQKGQSVLEILLAVALFAFIASGAIIAITGSLSTVRLGEEQLIATQRANEGLEAIDSIRNQQWSLLVNGTYGISHSGGVWATSGSSDLDPTGRYIRTLTIADVQRDNNGNIVSSGGTIDPDTKQVTSTVSWNFTNSRTNSVILTKNVTNWQTALGIGGGLISSCATYCQSLTYSNGTCRGTPGNCNQNGEQYESGGNLYCVLPSLLRCCCAP